VSRHLLDTNTISNATKPAPSAALVSWMAEQADEDLFICSLTVVEIRRGLLEKPAGKKRRELERWFSILCQGAGRNGAGFGAIGRYQGATASDGRMALLLLFIWRGEPSEILMPV